MNQGASVKKRFTGAEDIINAKIRLLTDAVVQLQEQYIALSSGSSTVPKSLEDLTEAVKTLNEDVDDLGLADIDINKAIKDIEELNGTQQTSINALNTTVYGSTTVTGLTTTVAGLTTAVQGMSQSATPRLIGSIQLWPSLTVPAGGNWMLCEGQQLSQTTYAALFSVIGHTFLYARNVPANMTTFYLPDTRSLYIRGAGADRHRSIGGMQVYQNYTVGWFLQQQMLAHTHPIAVGNFANRQFVYETLASGSKTDGALKNNGATITSGNPTLSTGSTSELCPNTLMLHYIICVQ